MHTLSQNSDTESIHENNHENTGNNELVELNGLIDSHIDANNTLSTFEDENTPVLEELKSLRAQKKETRDEIMEFMLENSIQEHTYRGQTFTTKVKEKVKYNQKLVETEFEESAVLSYKRKYAEQKASMKVKRLKTE